MVNSKKMSKSTVAIVLLSLLLVLSLILTATGAWFTNSKTNDANGTINFGKVEITSATATVTVDAGTKYLPGDTIKATATFENGSDVDIYYIYEVTAKAYEDEKKEKELAADLITVEGASAMSATATLLTTNGDEPVADISFKLVNTKEDNTLNGKSAYIEVTIVVKAVQAKNMTPETALQALKAMA